MPLVLLCSRTTLAGRSLGGASVLPCGVMLNADVACSRCVSQSSRDFLQPAYCLLELSYCVVHPREPVAVVCVLEYEEYVVSIADVLEGV